MSRESEWQDWGILPHEEMKHRCGPEECPHCNGIDDDWAYYTVGFTNSKEDYVKSSWGGAHVVGAITMECPVCFELSWVHMHGNFCLVRSLLVPTAKEACERMIERVLVEQTGKGER